MKKEKTYCDFCTKPRETREIRIDTSLFDVCSACDAKYFDRLRGKGRPVMNIGPFVPSYPTFPTYPTPQPNTYPVNPWQPPTYIGDPPYFPPIVTCGNTMSDTTRDPNLA